MLQHPLCSVRQDLELINQSKQDDARLHMSVTSWQTRTLAGFIAQTAQTDDRGFKALWKQVQEVTLDPDARDDRSIEQIIEEGAYVPEDRMTPGSFEAFHGQIRAAEEQANAAK